MPARDACQNLIAFVRDLVGEFVPAEEAETCPSSLSDDTIQSALDETRTKVRYERLDTDYTVLPGGTVVYLDFEARHPYMDDATLVVDNTYTPMDVEADFDEYDPLHGRFTTKVSVNTGLSLVGNRYDPFAAAAALLIKMAADVKRDIDFKDANSSLSASQAAKAMLILASEYQRKARIHTIEFGRSDI